MESRERICSKAVILFCSILLSIIDVERLSYGSDTSNCKIMENDLNCVMMSMAGSNTRFQRSSVPHEHDLIFVRIKNSTTWFLRCLTCDVYYCSKCGKMVHTKTDLILHQHCN